MPVLLYRKDSLKQAPGRQAQGYIPVEAPFRGPGDILRPPLPQVRNAFVAYVILFIARMSFVLATSIFGFVFITRKPEFQIPTFRYVATIAGLFALFCYTQELESLGKCLLGKENP